MSQLMQTILERLAEMFPEQTYQAKLERYIESKKPSSIEDVHMYIKEFEKCSQYN